jgi:O-succinylbenzoic acid--CoA ligase
VITLDAAEPERVLAALRAALAGTGPAVFVTDARASKLAGSGGEPFAPLALDTAVVIRTSGSTAEPKVIELSRQALLASAEAAHQHLGGAGQWMLALPLSYIAGLSVLVRSAASGLEPVIMPPGPFHPPVFFACAEELTAPRRYTSLVPVQLARLLDEAEQGASALTTLQRFDAVLIGGQALEPALRARAEAAGVRVVETYGSSETSGGCVYDGVPLPGVAVAVDAHTHEILISSPTLATGYNGNPALTAEKFEQRDGARWYRTGDVGALEHGRLTVRGRLDRVIISGGLKISLEAVEAAVRTLPAAREAVAVDIPDSEWGRRPAVVVARPAAMVPSSAEEDALRASIYDAIVAELGRVAAPKTVLVVEAIPQLPNGKPDLLALALLASATE